MLCDYHVHTHYSDDSEYLMEDVVKDGINRGLSDCLLYTSRCV